MDDVFLAVQASVLGFLPGTLDPIVRLAFAIGLGGLIGLDRELRDKPAGFRTIILICMGACLFTIVSDQLGGRDGESTRIAAQIAPGIGFLGAGAIIQNRQTIVGLTTAATIWAVAAVGMACGFGRLALATVSALCILVALFLFDSIEHFIGERRDVQDYLVATSNTDGAFHRVVSVVESANLRARKRTCYEEGQELMVRIVAIGAKADHERLRLQFVGSKEYALRNP
jgi:putative Mg2+ transporter-C (MgtC) family protein